MTLRARVLATHRWLGLIAAALWLLQAATGVFAVFHWEIDDAITAGAHHPTDWNAIEQRLRGLVPNSMWSSAGAPDRYDASTREECCASTAPAMFFAFAATMNRDSSRRSS